MTRNALICLRPAICCLIVLGWAPPLYATTVAIVRPPTPSSAVAETLSRVHGELLSVGLGVVTADRPTAAIPADMDWRVWLQQVASERGATAVIDVVGDDRSPAVDVWVVKWPPGRFEVTRVVAEPDATNVPERLALHAIEALRASLLEIDLAARQAHSEAAAQPAEVTLPAAPIASPIPRWERWAFEAGALAIGSLDGVGVAVLPMARAVWAPRPSVELLADVAGLGSKATVSTTAGSAKVSQHYGLLGGCYRFRPERTLWPFVALAAGALRTSVEGQSGSDTNGHAVDRWSVVVDGSVGAGGRLYGRYYMTMAAHVQMAEPYVAIHVLDSVAATTGRPNLVLTLTLGAWL